MFGTIPSPRGADPHGRRRVLAFIFRAAFETPAREIPVMRERCAKAPKCRSNVEGDAPDSAPLDARDGRCGDEPGPLAHRRGGGCDQRVEPGSTEAAWLPMTLEPRRAAVVLRPARGHVTSRIRRNTGDRRSNPSARDGGRSSCAAPEPT